MAKSIRKKKKSVNSLYVGKVTVFKLFLLGGVAIISALFIWYTFNVIDGLKKDTRSNVEKYVLIWQLAANTNMPGTELQFIFDEIIVKATFPIIVLDSKHNPIQYRNIKGLEQGDYSPETMALLREVADDMIRQNGSFEFVYADESDSFVNYFCYGDSDVINELKKMPFIEIGIIVAFLFVAFIGFQNIRRSEERYIWVGMAKETAHQLGTPISSLMGWVEIMEAEKEIGNFNESENQLLSDTIENMRFDIVRLEKVANRFGKIGSLPELQPRNLNEMVKDAVDYYTRRLPFEGEGIKILVNASEIPQVHVNVELFGWALENMIKNALQTVDSKNGLITLSTKLHPSNKSVLLDIEDNGRGIPVAAARKIFNAGFTTKKRGWGLGLTLVKRIIEEYHGGRICLKKSKPGETAFEIQLPVESV